MCSEYDRQHMMDVISEDDSFVSSQVIICPFYQLLHSVGEYCVNNGVKIMFAGTFRTDNCPVTQQEM